MTDAAKIIALKKFITNQAMTLFENNSVTAEEAAVIMRLVYQDYLELAHTDLISSIMIQQARPENDGARTGTVEEFLEETKDVGFVKEENNG